MLEKRHNEELYDILSPNNIKVIMSRNVRWAGFVAPLEDKGHAQCRVLVGKPEEKKSLESLEHKDDNNVTDIFKKQEGRTWNGLVWLGVAG